MWSIYTSDYQLPKIMRKNVKIWSVEGICLKVPEIFEIVSNLKIGVANASASSLNSIVQME